MKASHLSEAVMPSADKDVIVKGMGGARLEDGDASLARVFNAQQSR